MDINNEIKQKVSSITFDEGTFSNTYIYSVLDFDEERWPLRRELGEEFRAQIQAKFPHKTVVLTESRSPTVYEAIVQIK